MSNYADAIPNKRLKHLTPLAIWMRENGKSVVSLARELKVNVRSVFYWMNGQVLPDLVSAFKIEQGTKGEVPAEAWLGTPIGKALWAKASEGRKYRKRIKEGADVQDI